MRIILSRKGFDSSAGGFPSPIFPDGRMLSLPIPSRGSSIRYRDIQWDGGRLDGLVEGLTAGEVARDWGAHLDPDLRHASMRRAADWQPLFGQSGASQGHLRNCGVGEGDIFLFFGLFRRVTKSGDRLVWDRSSRPAHVIWGWLQVGQVLALDEKARVPAWAGYHPHCAMRHEKNNTLYMAAPTLELGGVDHGQHAGGGTFSRFDERLQLTDPNAVGLGQWRIPGWMFPSKGRPPLSFHSDMSRWSHCDGIALLRTVGRGQEFVLDERHYPEARGWIAELMALARQ